MKDLISKLEQDGFAEQILQKLIQIDGDIKMNRNHPENLKLLSEWVIELTSKATTALQEGKKATGFITLRNSCELLMLEIDEKKKDSGNT